MKSLPNVLTLFRLVALVPIAGLLLWPEPAARLAALALYVAACLTDLLDGRLARRLDAASAFGRMLDPIADKLLVAGLAMLLAASGDAPLLPAMAIVLREVLVSGLREHLGEKGVVVPVTGFARWKTALQMVALGCLLPEAAGFDMGEVWPVAGRVLFWLAAGLTVATGWGYLKAALAGAPMAAERARWRG